MRTSDTGTAHPESKESPMRLQRLCAIVIAVVVPALLAGPAWAWGPKGHMMVACVAYRQLPPEVQKGLMKVLQGNEELFAQLQEDLPQGLSEEDRNLFTFIKAATWP